jgi:hypothetical protein
LAAEITTALDMPLCGAPGATDTVVPALPVGL